MIDEASLDALMRIADGSRIAEEAVVRAVQIFGLSAVITDPDATVYLPVSPLRSCSESTLARANPTELRALRLLATFEDHVEPKLVVERLTVAALEALSSAGLTVHEDVEGSKRRFIRLRRPLRALVRSLLELEPSAPEWALHANVVETMAAEFLIQHEFDGELFDLRSCRGDLIALCLRAQKKNAFLSAALGALPALAPLAMHDELTASEVAILESLIAQSKEHPERSLRDGRARAALCLILRAQARPLPRLIELAADATDYAKHLGDAELVGRALRIWGALLLDAGQPREAEQVLQRALQALESASADVHRGVALAFLAMARGRNGDYSGAIALLRESAALHRAHGNARLLMYDKNLLGGFYAQSGDLRRGRIASEEVIRLAAERRDPATEAFARATLSFTLLGGGDIARAREEAERAAAMFQSLNQVPLSSYCMSIIGIAHLFEGNLDRGIAVLDDAGRTARPVDRALAAAYVATIEAKDGLFDQARTRLANGRESLDPQNTVIGKALALLTAAVRWIEEQGPALEVDEPPSVDLRVARLWLDRLGVPTVTASLASAAACNIKQDGTRFSFDGRELRLGGKPVLARLLAALARARVSAPAQPISVHDLIHATWPNERMMEHSARTRLHACVMRLRQLGLRSALVQSDGGYWLDPHETAVSD
jgi:tetratricopeptide (TPR) repeat protein